MILQALAEYYCALEKQGRAASPGWGPVKVSFALYLGEDGTLERVVSVQTEQQRGKKTVPAPQTMSLPAPVKRASGVAANFLCDNSSYILGADTKGKPKRTAECFAAFYGYLFPPECFAFLLLSTFDMVGLNFSMSVSVSECFVIREVPDDACSTSSRSPSHTQNCTY